MINHSTLIRHILFAVVLCLSFLSVSVYAQTMAFTYQGRLTDNGNPADSFYDFEFRLFDALTDGTQKGTTLTLTAVEVTSGAFTAQLEFVGCADCFNGAPRFLDISVRPAGGGAYTQLAPRQPLTSSPYAVRSLFSTVADGLSEAGSAGYIQNTTTQQESSNFNISGNGSVGGSLSANQLVSNSLTVSGPEGIFTNRVNVITGGLSLGFDASSISIGAGNATTSINIGGPNTSFISVGGNPNLTISRITVTGSEGVVTNRVNTLGGPLSLGSPLPGGASAVNIFAPTSISGTLNVAGALNADGSGLTSLNADNITGGTLSINRGGTGLSLPGATGNFLRSNGASWTSSPLQASDIPGASGNYIQNQNTGSPQESSNFNISGTGKANVFDAATHFSISGLRAFTVNGPFDGQTIFTATNTFAGDSAGLNTLPDPEPSLASGKFNSFFGAGAGKANTEGGFNAFFGVQAGLFNTIGTSNSFFGYLAGPSNITGESNAFFGVLAGDANTTGSVNAFFGVRAGQGNTSGSWNTLIGGEARVLVGNINNATAIGSRAVVSQSDSLVLGSIEGFNFCTPFFNCKSVNVGIGTPAPAARLHVSGTGIIRARINSDDNAGLALTLNDQPGWSVATVTGGQFQIFNDVIGQNAFWINNATNNVGIGTSSPNDRLEVNGILRVSTLGSAGGAQLCRNGSNQISQCSSSLRYKSNIAALDSGFELINRLRPVTFEWKQNGESDLGLVAEEVAKVEPLLVTRNEKGEIEGVKYDRVAVVLLNAIREQQQQIDTLKKIVCKDHPKAAMCKATPRTNKASRRKS